MMILNHSLIFTIWNTNGSSFLQLLYIHTAIKNKIKILKPKGFKTGGLLDVLSHCYFLDEEQQGLFCALV